MATMLSRPAIRAGASVARQTQAARAFSSTPSQMATLRELESRVKSVKNIEKITKSMKMIATTRLGKAQAAMQQAKQYGAANTALFDEAEAAKDAESDQRVLYIVMSSDRGLCGSIHSSISKAARNTIAQDGKDSEENPVPLVVLGDKPKAQLSRVLSKNIVLSVNQLGKAVPTYADALSIAQEIEESGVEYDKVKLIHNKFVSALSFEPTSVEIYNTEALKKSPNFAAYEVEDEELIKDVVSFSLANGIYAGLVEGFAAEISSRRNAMDNASKSAGEMIDSLQLQYNRMRQSAITNDLVDIITGANAL